MFLSDDSFWRDDAPRFLVPPGMPTPDDGGTIPLGHVLFQTSGSTGKPKWIALSKQALMTSAAAVNEHLAVTPESCWGLALPIHHVGGFGIAARARQAGCRLAIFPDRWQPESFVRWCAEQAVTHTSLVPTQVHDLVAAGVICPPAVKCVVVGGGQLAKPTGRSARDLGWPVLASYGMTEACSQIATQPLSSLEKPFENAPVPLLPIWRVREEQESGRLAICGPALFSGTWSRETGYRPRGEPWFLTQDIVRMTPQGLIPLGRADETVKILGELVSPAAVERTLFSLWPGLVDHLIVIACPDDRRGHRLVPACDDFHPPAEIGSWVEKHNAASVGHLRLSPPVFPPFPRSPLGKPLRAEIAATVLRANPS